MFPQTSSDEPSSAAADSDSSASNNSSYLSKPNNIIITEDEAPQTSGSFYDKTNENIVGQLFKEENELVKHVNPVNNTNSTTFVSSAQTNFKKITISCPPISSIPADTYKLSSTSKSSPSQTSFSNNSSDDSQKCFSVLKRIPHFQTVRKSKKKTQHPKNWVLPNCSNISPSELKTAETLENLAIALTKLSEATLKINSSATDMPPPTVKILHPSKTYTSDIHSDISTYDSDSAFETEVVYTEKRPSKRMTQVLVTQPPTPTPIISNKETFWIDETTLSFGYSTTSRKKRLTLPNNPKHISNISKPKESKILWIPKLTV